ncbi:MAG TPA: PAS domain S-box protein [Gaiellaceae bacterium]|nr:PAS domain S-box protein [Gaiellaceae bacterium]
MDRPDLVGVLVEREMRYQRVLAQLPGIVWTTDRELAIVSSGGRTSGLGLPSGSVVGRDVDELASEIALFDPQQHRRALAGARAEYEVAWEGRIYVVTLEPFRGPNEALEGVIGMALDQTERRAAEAALRESEGRFRALIENSSDVTMILESDLTIRYVSHSAERILGWSVEELVGTRPSDFWDPEELPDLLARVASGLESPGLTDYGVHRVRTKDGTWRLVETTSVNLLDDPRVAGLLNTLRDVTERTALEERLSASERLEAIGQLAGGIAHDFNNVLLVIRGYSNVLRAELAGTPHLADLDEIDNAAQRAANLTRQLLAFGRRQMLRPQLLDVGEVVRGLGSLLRSAIPERLELDLELDEEAPWVEADPSQLEQILLNLVVNSRDAMPESGRITVRVGSVVRASADDSTAPPLAPGSYVVLEVEDEGSGIPPEVLPHIFEPFFTTKAEGVGTGLGLPTVYGAVAQAGGSVGIRTGLDEGTTITVYLPVAEDVGAAFPDDCDPAAAAPNGSERILLVEDEAAVRDLVQRVLEDAGYRVCAAARPGEALAALGDGEGFELLVSDVVMPEMSGYELASRIRADHPGMRMLFMSGYSHDAAKDAGLLAEETALLRKPFAPADLARAVRAVLDREAA